MQAPLKISFKGCEPSSVVRLAIETRAQNLEKLHRRITACQIIVEVPGDHHRHGEPFNIRIQVALPNRKDIFVNKAHGEKSEHEHILVAIKDAFVAVERQIGSLPEASQNHSKLHDLKADSGFAT